MLTTRRPPLSGREVGIILGAGLAAVVVVSGLVYANIRWVDHIRGGGTFYSIWSGGRANLLARQDPYSLEQAARAQQYAYGSPARPGQNPYRLDIPFFLLQLALPVSLIPDVNLARAIWISLGQAALVGAFFLSCRLAEWHPSRSLLAVIALSLVLSLPAVMALVDGSLAPIVLLLYVGVLWAIENGADELAGGLLALCMCKWETGLLFLLVVGLRAFREKRWRVLSGFGMTLVILIGLSALVFPGWFMPFLIATVAMVRSPHDISTYTALPRLLGDQGVLAARILTTGLLAILTTEWIGRRAGDSRKFLWVAALALASTPLLGLKTSVGDLVVVAPGFFLVLAGGSARPSHGRWTAAYVAICFAVPWLIYVLPWRGPGRLPAQDLLLVLLPLACIIGMYWTRWWFLRPARTWLDQIRKTD